jgi:hypothetical protein
MSGRLRPRGIPARAPREAPLWAGRGRRQLILRQPAWQGSKRVETGIVTITLTGGQTGQLYASLGLRGGEIDAGGLQL